MMICVRACVRARVPLAAAAEHSQKLAGIHALLLGHLLHIKAHVHQELDDVHLLAGELVPDGGTGGVAVWPRAAVDKVHGATFRWRLVVAVVVEAAVPAVQRSWQGRPFDLHIGPVAGRQHKGALSVYKLGLL